MQDDIYQFEKRKQEHIKLALSSDNQAIECNVFDQIVLPHEALPDFNFTDINIASTRFGLPIEKPFMVSSMTAGHLDASPINRTLMQACSESGWAMGVGSQRRELFDKKAALEWFPLRRDFPHLSLFGNLGIAQLLEVSLSQIQALIDSLQADALIIHCNPLQEVIQPEGTPSFQGCWAALSKLVKQVNIPIIIKETGCGFSIPTLKRLNEIGVAAVDVSGLGGTHWGRIEGKRAGDRFLPSKVAETFRNWGIDTVQSVKNALSIHPQFEIWGSGGVRQGLDAAKLFALGATTVGFAKPMLEAALQGVDNLLQLMTAIEYELRVAMFCTGSPNIQVLRERYAHK